MELLIIRPHDKSTNFLDRIKNHLDSSITVKLHYFNIKPNNGSHDECLSAIQDFSVDGLILFMGHGKSNSLYGAKGDYYGSIENEFVKLESPEKYFYKEIFINEQNIDVFDGKKIISLSCNSNGQIGRKAVENGAKVFLGFGDLPTSVRELKDRGEENSPGKSLSKIERAFKSEINYIMKNSLNISILNNHSFTQLVDVINFISNQRISYYLVNQKTLRERKLVANYIYDFKKEIKIYGDKHQKLII